jgi:hypothetical protein
MNKIILGDFKFQVRNDKLEVSQFDKSMGMYESLKEYPVSELIKFFKTPSSIAEDFVVKTYKTVVIPKSIMEKLSKYLKEQLN